MIAAELKAFLQTAGTLAGTKVFYDTPPQPDPLPYIILTEVDGGDWAEHLTGVAPIAETVWQIYSLAATKAECEQLAEQVRQRLHRFAGMMGEVYVQNVSMLSPGAADIDRPKDKSYAPRYFRLSPYSIWHQVAEVTN